MSKLLARSGDLSRLWLHCILFVGEIEPDSSVQPIGESRHIAIVSFISFF